MDPPPASPASERSSSSGGSTIPREQLVDLRSRGSRGGLLGRALARAMRDIDRALCLRRCRSVGRAAYIQRPRWLVGAPGIAIGQGVFVWRFARIEVLRVFADRPTLEIGSGTQVLPFVHIGAVTSVRIGQQCLFAAGVFITDHDHDFGTPSNPAVSSGRVIASEVVIGDRVFLGERVCVLRGVRIGDDTIVGAHSVVVSDLPPRCMAVGAPAKVVRRWDEASQSWARAG